MSPNRTLTHNKMKKIIIPFIGFVLLSCSSSDHSHAAESQITEIVKEPAIEQHAPELIQVDDSANSEPEVPLLKPVDKDTLVINNPYQTIKRIFETYNQYQESSDSPANLDSLRQSLKILETSEVDSEILTLVINVWMYYSVTDFKTMEYTGNVLRAHKEESIKAINNRIENKMDWESPDSAPYSDLPSLLRSIEN